MASTSIVGVEVEGELGIGLNVGASEIVGVDKKLLSEAVVASSNIVGIDVVGALAGIGLNVGALGKVGVEVEPLG
jgi:hypothetical protein